MRVLIAFALIFFSLSAAAQDKEWYQVGTSQNSNDDYSIKFGTGEISENKQGERLTVVVGRVVHSNATINIYKWYVTETDCARGYGNVTTLDVDGNYLRDTPYAKDGGSIASAIAEIICAAAEASKRATQSKGI